MGVGAAIAGATIVGGAYSANQAKKGAKSSANAAKHAANLQQEQYMQGRQDLQPYRDVAVGAEILDDDGNVTGYEGGALNVLAGYGRSKENPNDYIPQSDMPRYQGSDVGGLPSVNGSVPQYSVRGNVPDYNVQGNIPQFNVQGDIPEFDGTQFDIYKDQSYDFRQAEQEKGINRSMASMGKVTSGNRLDEIMKRSGEMASQEYGAAYNRMTNDYNINRQNEQTSYGRDVFSYEQGRSNENQQYGRDNYSYDRNRDNEGENFSRDNYAYGQNRANSLTQYGFDTDSYNRSYGEEKDQYGRDLTQFNADTTRENSLYGRGVDNYGRAYGRESDFLNRQSTLANVGQSAVNSGNTLGANSASNQGNALIAAGNAKAAGTIGQAGAYGNAVDQVAQLAGNYFAPSPNYVPYGGANTHNYNGEGGGIPYDQFVGNSPNLNW